MGRPRVLDEALMRKIALKTGKSELTAVNSMVSRKAAKHGISAEAALVLLAKENGIGAAVYQRSLDSAKQAEVREALPSVFTRSAPQVTGRAARAGDGKAPKVLSQRASLKLTIEYLIADPDLRSRCEDILLASKNFDRAINQATLVLEDRIRKKAQPTARLVGENLVNYAFKEDPSKTVLRVTSNDPEDQRGITQLLRGMVPMFRNKTHHHIIGTVTREEAMRVCGFIDVLLRTVDDSVKV